MQIVIDIDENLYTRLFDNGVDNYDDAVDIAKAIRKGTPLPKRHGDLKDISKLSHIRIRGISDYALGYNERTTEIERDIAYLPTIIEADKEWITD